jgi:hypothetical protein
MNGFQRFHFLGDVRQAEGKTINFGFAKQTIPITLWEGAGRNLVLTDGKLTLEGRPVAGATIRVDQYTLPQPTAADGGFKFLRDQTLLDRRRVTVVDATKARIDSKPISNDQQTQLTHAGAAVSTVYLLTLAQQPDLHHGDQDVKITGRLTFADKKTPVPPVVLWDYIIRGVIRDPRGNPVKNAIVSISGEGGESSALSNPTGASGEYTLRFFPEQDNQYDIRAGYGETLYTSMQPVHFSPGESAEMDLVIPDTGDDLLGTGPNGTIRPKELDGAEYIGTLTGLAINQRPIDAALTWPDEQGAFTISIPSVGFTDTVSFFQAQLRFFTPTKQAPGGPVSKGIVPAELASNMPRGLHPLRVAAA